MADKVVAIGSILSPTTVRVNRLYDKLLGKLVPGTWTPPATVPYIGCRGKRACLGSCFSDSVRDTTASAVAFTVSGAIDRNCTQSNSGGTLTTHIVTSGFAQVNGTYIGTIAELASCEVCVIPYRTTFSATIDITTTFANGSPTQTKHCDVTLIVELRRADDNCKQIELVLTAVVGNSASTQVIHQAACTTWFPCFVAGSAEQGTTLADPVNSLGPCVSTYCTTFSWAINLCNCDPWGSLSISRVWS